MNVMSYKGYSARIEFDAEDELFVGHLANLNDIVGFHADTVAAFQETRPARRWMTICKPAPG